MTSTGSSRSAIRWVALLVLLGIAAIFVVALAPWPRPNPPAPDNAGLRERVARECGITPGQLYDEQEQDFGVFWWWTDERGRHRASLTNGVVTCGSG